MTGGVEQQEVDHGHNWTGLPEPGVDPTPTVTILREEALAAVATRVAPEELDEARWREQLAALSWLEATAGAHAAVRDHDFTSVARAGGRIQHVDTGAGDSLGAAYDLLPGTIGAAR